MVDALRHKIPSMVLGNSAVTSSFCQHLIALGSTQPLIEMSTKEFHWGLSLSDNACRKVAGSIPDGVIGIFHRHNPSSRTEALGSTQPLTDTSPRNISWVAKGGRCVRLTTLPPSCADCLEIWEPQTPGTLRACPGL